MKEISKLAGIFTITFLAIAFALFLFCLFLYIIYLALVFVASVFLPQYDSHDAGLAMLFVFLLLGFIFGSSHKKT